jgi:hypothetical protein
MFNPDDLAHLIRELGELNNNLRESRRAMHQLGEHLKSAAGSARELYRVGKQINVLNQILLQIGQKAGMAGMVEKLLSAVMEFAKRAG